MPEGHTYAILALRPGIGVGGLRRATLDPLCSGPGLVLGLLTRTLDRQGRSGGYGVTLIPNYTATEKFLSF